MTVVAYTGSQESVIARADLENPFFITVAKVPYPQPSPCSDRKDELFGEQGRTGIARSLCTKIFCEQVPSRFGKLCLTHLTTLVAPGVQLTILI